MDLYEHETPNEEAKAEYPPSRLLSGELPDINSCKNSNIEPFSAALKAGPQNLKIGRQRSLSMEIHDDSTEQMAVKNDKKPDDDKEKM